MDTNKHKCDECDAEIKRHIFCSRLCNQRFFNKARYHSDASTDKEVLNLVVDKQDPKMFVICPKHGIFKKSCGCK